MGFFGLLRVAMSRNDFDAQSLVSPLFIRVSGPTGGRDRTDTFLRILDFESSASANSATPAWIVLRCLLPVYSGEGFAQMKNSLAVALGRKTRHAKPGVWGEIDPENAAEGQGAGGVREEMAQISVLTANN
jgi:hypothetical protein